MYAINHISTSHCSQSWILNNDTKSICEQIYLLYNNFHFVTKLAINSPNIPFIWNQNDKYQFNITFLIHLGHFETLKYWIVKVKCLVVYTYGKL